MMNEERWQKLREVFNDPKNFTPDYSEYWYNTGVPGDLGIASDLFDWLECSGSRPSYKMIEEFREHGYSVRPGERDSFGWLTGIVTDLETGRKICFG